MDSLCPQRGQIEHEGYLHKTAYYCPHLYQQMMQDSSSMRHQGNGHSFRYEPLTPQWTLLGFWPLAFTYAMCTLWENSASNSHSLCHCKEMDIFRNRDNYCHGIFFSHYVVISARFHFSIEPDTISEDLVIWMKTKFTFFAILFPLTFCYIGTGLNLKAHFPFWKYVGYKTGASEYGLKQRTYTACR